MSRLRALLLAVAVVLLAVPPAAAQHDDRAEILFWESVRGSGTPGDCRAYLERFPNGTFAPLARARITAMAPPPSALAAVVPVPVPQPAPQPAPAPPAQPAAAAVRLTAAELVQRVPNVSPAHARTTAQGYLSAPGPNRALAVNPERQSSFRVQGFSTAEDAETVMLGRCQLTFGTPCILVAVNDTIVPQELAARRGEMAEVMGYGRAAGAKAMALHPQGRVAVAAGARSPEDAAQRALAACRAMAQRERLPGNCTLYAVGDQVVLPQRLAGTGR